MSGAHVERAIKRLRVAADSAGQMYNEPITVCYSGGKDSQILVRLALEAGIPFRVKHSLTTVDAPETVYTVRDTFGALKAKGIEAEINKPELTMWKLIPKNKFPLTRLVRYCCRELKERNTGEKFIATGVRQSESVKRKNRGTVDVIARNESDRAAISDEVFLSNDNDERRKALEHCMNKKTLCVNPIIDWTDAQALDYFWNECEIHNPLYSEGFTRVGCIGCPMANRSQRVRQFARWPKYKDENMRAFDAMLTARRERGFKPRKVMEWENPEDVFRWWMNDKTDPNQLMIDGFGDDE